MDIQAEIERRFKLQTEYLGESKPVNKITPLVSVSVATYQHAPYIRECLDSILNQETNFPFEIIIGEDESLDGTREICIEYAEKFPDKIRLFLRDREISHLKDENGKLIKRLNGIFTFGFMSSRGKYIAVCEGDDYWSDPLKLQKQVEVLENDPDCSLCFHPTKFVRNNNPLDSYIHAPSIKRDKYTMIDVIRGGGGFMATNSMVYRTEYKKDNYPDWARKAPVGDLPLMLVLASKGHFRYVDDVMSVYRIMSSDSAWSAKMKDWKNRKKHHYQILDMWDEFDKWSEFKFHKYVVEKKRNNTINFYKGAIHHFLKKFL